VGRVVRGSSSRSRASSEVSLTRSQLATEKQDANRHALEGDPPTRTPSGDCIGERDCFLLRRISPVIGIPIALKVRARNRASGRRVVAFASDDQFRAGPAMSRYAGGSGSLGHSCQGRRELRR
jgi:hypothetical protein